MAHVKFTPNLTRFFPDLRACDIDATTVADIVTAVDQRWRGLGDYIVDEQGALRKHVNIFVGDEHSSATSERYPTRYPLTPEST